VAAEDQAFNTDYFKNRMWEEEVDSNCWLYKQHHTIDHLP
jgi:hypothetical protein